MAHCSRVSQPASICTARGYLFFPNPQAKPLRVTLMTQPPCRADFSPSAIASLPYVDRLSALGSEAQNLPTMPLIFLEIFPVDHLRIGPIGEISSRRQASPVAEILRPYGACFPGRRLAHDQFVIGGWSLSLVWVRDRAHAKRRSVPVKRPNLLLRRRSAR
jgi:hypothetical protein